MENRQPLTEEQLFANALLNMRIAASYLHDANINTVNAKKAWQKRAVQELDKSSPLLTYILGRPEHKIPAHPTPVVSPPLTGMRRHFNNEHNRRLDQFIAERKAHDIAKKRILEIIASEIVQQVGNANLSLSTSEEEMLDAIQAPSRPMPPYLYDAMTAILNKINGTENRLAIPVDAAKQLAIIIKQTLERTPTEQSKLHQFCSFENKSTNSFYNSLKNLEEKSLTAMLPVILQQDPICNERLKKPFTDVKSSLKTLYQNALDSTKLRITNKEGKIIRPETKLNGQEIKSTLLQLKALADTKDNIIEERMIAIASSKSCRDKLDEIQVINTKMLEDIRIEEKKANEIKMQHALSLDELKKANAELTAAQDEEKKLTQQSHEATQLLIAEEKKGQDIILQQNDLRNKLQNIDTEVTKNEIEYKKLNQEKTEEELKFNNNASFQQEVKELHESIFRANATKAEAEKKLQECYRLKEEHQKNYFDILNNLDDLLKEKKTANYSDLLLKNEAESTINDLTTRLRSLEEQLEKFEHFRLNEMKEEELLKQLTAFKHSEQPKENKEQETQKFIQAAEIALEISRIKKEIIRWEDILRETTEKTAKININSTELTEKLKRDSHKIAENLQKLEQDEKAAKALLDEGNHAENDAKSRLGTLRAKLNVFEEKIKQSEAKIKDLKEQQVNLQTKIKTCDDELKQTNTKKIQAQDLKTTTEKKLAETKESIQQKIIAANKAKLATEELDKKMIESKIIDSEVMRIKHLEEELKNIDSVAQLMGSLLGVLNVANITEKNIIGIATMYAVDEWIKLKNTAGPAANLKIALTIGEAVGKAIVLEAKYATDEILIRAAFTAAHTVATAPLATAGSNETLTKALIASRIAAKDKRPETHPMLPSTVLSYHLSTPEISTYLSGFQPDPALKNSIQSAKLSLPNMALTPEQIKNGLEHLSEIAKKAKDYSKSIEMRHFSFDSHVLNKRFVEVKHYDKPKKDEVIELSQSTVPSLESKVSLACKPKNSATKTVYFMHQAGGQGSPVTVRFKPTALTDKGKLKESEYALLGFFDSNASSMKPTDTVYVNRFTNVKNVLFLIAAAKRLHKKLIISKHVLKKCGKILSTSFINREKNIREFNKQLKELEQHNRSIIPENVLKTTYGSE